MVAKALIHEDFLLESKPAQRLYHEFAANMPILDYHCHLPPDEIAADKRYGSISEIWLGGDHYKWRAMRANGVAEAYCTGDASDREKFDKWAETVPQLLRNPLYHWTHLELTRYFGITELLCPESAERIWETCNDALQQPDFSCRSLMKRSKVRLVCTTDDPTDSLEDHRSLAEDADFDIAVLPAWRPDRGMAIESPEAFNAWVDRLAAAADVDVRDFSSYLEALEKRHAFFHERGCRLSDHGLETAYAEAYTTAQVEEAFLRIRAGKALSDEQALRFKSAMLYEFGVMDHSRGWSQQYHLGALRSTNSRMLARLGPDTGFDSMGDFEVARPLARLLDRLDQANQLAPTLLYNVNPVDNAVMATMIGNFQDGSIPGKMQWGSAWWHLDQLDGMTAQIETLSQMGLLSRYVGMLTDSRSFLSYTRHEYFRRLLCNILGDDMVRGRVPEDYALVGEMVRNIAYHNAVNYFGFDVPETR
jgi:glucuronate isomerase